VRGVAQTWRDEILPSIRMLRVRKQTPAFASSMRPKQHIVYGGLLLVNG